MAPIQTILTLWAICEMARGVQEKNLSLLVCLFLPWRSFLFSSRYFRCPSLPSSRFVFFLLFLIPALCSTVLLSDELVYLCSRLPVLSRPGISTKARQRNKLSSSNCSVNLLVIVVMVSISRECRAAYALSRLFVYTRY